MLVGVVASEIAILGFGFSVLRGQSEASRLTAVATATVRHQIRMRIS